jgi:PAS domain S-box-containing protein
VGNLNHSWFAAVRLTVAVAIAYFLAARLGLVLRSQVGVAIFWPAAGIAAGGLIALGPAARLPVAIAVALASIASSLTVDRNLWLAIALGVLDVGEVLLPAWLVQRWFGAVFKLEEVRQVLGFLVASSIGAAVTAAAAAIAIGFAEPTAIPFNVWRQWFTACSLGLITVAPLLIGLADALRESPPLREGIEGAIALVTLAALSAFLIFLPQGPWTTGLPVALVFPVLLWVAVRCRPVFAAAAMFVVTLTVVWSTTSNMGHFGDASIPLADRMLAAQTHVLAGTLLALVLAALFAERRRNESTLKASNQRLQLAFEREAQLALAGKMGRVGGFTFDIGSGAMQVSPGYAAIHGLPEGTRETTRTDWRTRVHPDDLARLDANLQCDVDARRSEHDCQYRIICSTGEMRWIEARSFISYDSDGAALRIIGVNIDVTQRKKAELALVDLDLQLALAGRAGLVGTYAYDTDRDCDAEKAQISPGYAAIQGLPEGTTEITRSAWLARVHPEDVERLQVLRKRAFLQRQREYSIDYRIVRAGEVRWIESRTFISYNSDGHPQRLIGVNIDVTERKRTEALLSESKDRLADAMVAGQVMAFEWDAITGLSQRSDNAANILGSEQRGITTSSRNDFVKRVHPDDRASLKTRIRELRPDDASYALSFRHVRPDGRQVWLEETAKGEFDATGRLLRIRGLTRDITEGKNAELALAERNVQLALAGRAVLVGSYTYDVTKGRLQVSEGYAAIHGLPEGTTETSLSEWRARLHPEDLERAQGLRDQAFADRRKEDNAEYRIILATGEVRWIEERGSISYGEDGCPERVVGVNIDITGRKQAEKQRNTLNAELDHRVKNVLATVGAIIFQTQNANATITDFVASVNRRIKSLASTHELLSHARWQGVSLQEIVRREFAPYSTGNTDISGPSITLRPEAAQAVAMVLHELATNAAKYGALSNHTGRVSVRWFWLRNGIPYQRLAIDWRETDGPPVSAPSASGYGTSTIRELIPFELGGKVELVFAYEGIRCRLEIPVDWISSGRGIALEPGALSKTF